MSRDAIHATGDREARVHTIRIFVSSPRDVGSERALAARAIDRLQFEFRGVVDIEPIFWEQMPMRATDTFQAQIPLAGDSDICVFILWSWFGTPLPEGFHRPDGSRYASGTEFEFENAFDSHSKTGAPDILVYRKTAELHAAIQNRDQVMERLAQRDAVQSFIDRYFRGEGGVFKAAFREFDGPADFEEMVEAHLRELVRDHLRRKGLADDSETALWTQSPFRGLEIFDIEHALIFCGRTRAVTEVLDALQHGAAAGHPLVLVIGTSGSGKSSLVRGGLVPMLIQPRVVEDVVAWRHAVLRPGDAGADGPLMSLAKALVQDGAVPELTAGGTTAEALAEVLHDRPAMLLPSLTLALSRAAEQAQHAGAVPSDAVGAARLALVVDQLEELFVPSVAAAERNAFAEALATLAKSGLVWVLATLRTDFFTHLGQLPDSFGDLIRGDGTYELRPPRAAEIAQMIRRPALIAGLSFERNPETEEGLDDVLRDAASANPAALPLLQFALDELYKRRHGNVLRFADYAALGGLEGALQRRAEEEFQHLPEAVQAALPAVLSALVRIGLEDDEIAARRTARSRLAGSPGAVELADAFVAARLFVADRSESDEATIGIAHEALVREWPRAREWIAANKERLKLRAQIAAAAMLWRSSGGDRATLLPPGRALTEAAALLRQSDLALTPETAEFAEASLARAAVRRRHLRLGLAAAAAVVLAAMLGGAFYYEAYVTPTVRYYASFSRRWGGYVGGGPELSAEQVQRRVLSLKFTFSGRLGPIVSWEQVNGHGYCPQVSPLQTFFGQLHPGSPRVVCRSLQIYRDGKLVGEDNTDRNGRPVFSFMYTDAAHTVGDYRSAEGGEIALSQSGASRVRFTRYTSGPLAGLEQSVMFLEPFGHPEPDRNGRYGYSFEYDDRGRVTVATALGEDGKPTLPRDEPATVRFTLDDQGNALEYYYYDERGGRMRNPDLGAAIEKVTHDSDGNPTSYSLFDEAGRLVAGKQGFTRTTMKYDRWGDVIENDYWDAYGRPVKTSGGYARSTSKYDAMGRWIEQDYFDENGKPIAVGGGAQSLRVTYDRNGNIAETGFFDHSGQRVTLAAGYARVARTYDAAGNVLTESFLDRDGHPVNQANGAAQEQTTYDASGYPIDLVFRDKSGAKVKIKEGYAETRQTYDARGNAVGTAYFDENGKPVASDKGWASDRVRYDDRGDIVEQDFFDTKGAPTLVNVGYTMILYTFDARGNEIEFGYYTAPGQLLDKSKGCPRILRSYDEHRHMTDRSCRDGAGNLVMTKAGYARQSIAYDAFGHPIERSYFDDHDKPVVMPGLGYAVAKFRYDDENNLVEGEWFDADGHPVALPRIGCAHVVLTYAKGRVTGHTCIKPPAPAATKG